LSPLRGILLSVVGQVIIPCRKWNVNRIVSKLFFINKKLINSGNFPEEYYKWKNHSITNYFAFNHLC